MQDSLNNNDTTNTQSTTTVYQDEEASAVWEERFEELVHWERGHGHCRVPVDSGVLGKWVMKLREKYKRHLKEEGRYRGQLTADRIARLNSLGFEWSVRPPNTPWEERFAQLQQFHVQHGHSRVKRSCGEFGEWVQKQRKLVRAGKMSQERLALLQSVGFEERIMPTNKTWEESFGLLLDFRRHHGHTNVPKPIKGMPPGDEHSLAVWADRQRRLYHTAHLLKKQSCLSKTRVKKLLEVGFDFGHGGNARGSQQEAWTRRLSELREYIQVHGDANVPTSYPENKQLGRWVSEQRSMHVKWKKGQRSTLTQERRMALEGIGFQWKKPKSNKKRTATATAKPRAPIAAAVSAEGHVKDGKLPALDSTTSIVDGTVGDGGGDVSVSEDADTLSTVVGQTASV